MSGHRPRPVRVGRCTPGDGLHPGPARRTGGPRPRLDRRGSRRDLLHHQRHRSLRGRADARRRQRARTRSSTRRRWRRCSKPTTGPILAFRGGGSDSSGPRPARIAWSGTTGSFRASTPSSWWPPTTASASSPSPTGRRGRSCGWRPSSRGCCVTCSAFPTRSCGPTSRTTPRSGTELCGRYRLPPRISDLRGRLAIAGGVEVFARGGRLVIRALTPVPALYRGLPLHPDDEDDPYVFRLDLSGLGDVERARRVRPRCCQRRGGHPRRPRRTAGVADQATHRGRARASLTAAMGALLVAAARDRSCGVISDPRRYEWCERRDSHRALEDERDGAGRGDQDEARRPACRGSCERPTPRGLSADRYRFASRSRCQLPSACQPPSTPSS